MDDNVKDHPGAKAAKDPLQTAIGAMQEQAAKQQAGEIKSAFDAALKAREAYDGALEHLNSVIAKSSEDRNRATALINSVKADRT